ncbi:b60 [miniopterid betaherpesvirus 1]|uniref:B60 n=1 Tax=miniopterid betaherpesvirus 1 TaxID=3070189 RepID=I3VQ49_9BETA|nr:b60 [miniopterid betaherpesvirus 1]AFK83893.1 b60 [miniopterid betaherpesvirus 1]
MYICKSMINIQQGPGFLGRGRLSAPLSQRARSNVNCSPANREGRGRRKRRHIKRRETSRMLKNTLPSVSGNDGEPVFTIVAHLEHHRFHLVTVRPYRLCDVRPRGARKGAGVYGVLERHLEDSSNRG